MFQFCEAGEDYEDYNYEDVKTFNVTSQNRNEINNMSQFKKQNQDFCSYNLF